MVTKDTLSKVIEVLIVDDHPIVRNGLSTAISRETDMRVVGEASDGIEAEDMALQLKPDVVIMDIFMPRQNGLESIISIRQKLPDTRFLVLTISDYEDDLFQAIRFGADGYLLKSSNIKDVVDAVRKVADGQAVLSPHMTARVMRELRENCGIEPSFPAREKQVLELIADGLSTAEIAKKLSVSSGTVNTHVNRLLRKLHVKNRAEAVAYFMQRRPYLKSQ